MDRGIFVIRVMLLMLSLLSFPSYGDDFADAEIAAKEGRYRDVVNILTKTLDDPKLELKRQAVAHVNRGIAYRLLNAYALAEIDLLRTMRLDPVNVIALNQLGLLAEWVKKDDNLAASLYKRGADLKYAASMINLAALYREGRGVPKNPALAFTLLLGSAEADSPNAYSPLGVMYAKGEGTTVNSKKAFIYFQRGAEAGISSAYYRLGFAYERGLGTNVNLQKALRNYRFAAVQGHGEAQGALGYFLKRGHGVEKDLTEAATWYQLAADQGVASASNRLAWLLATCPTTSLCNGEKAVQLALSAIEISKEEARNPELKDKFGKVESSMNSMLDTLGAAYARNGQFDLAISTMQDLLSSVRGKGGRYSVFKRRMADYEKGRAYQL
jgi:TPR repeat protein